VNGIPMFSPENSVARKRPSRIIRPSSTPWLTMGSPAGSIQLLIVQFHLPAPFASQACSGPGWAAFR